MLSPAVDGSRDVGRVINQILQFRARLKVRNSLGRHIYPRAGLRIASHSRLALAGAKTPEPANLDLIARAKAPDDAVKDCFHDDLGVLPRHFYRPGHFLDQI